MHRILEFRRVASLLAAGGLCLTLAAGVSPQASAGPGQKGEKAARQGLSARRQGMGPRWMAMLEKLNLSDNQKVRLRAIQARYRDEFQKVRQNGGDRQARRGQMKTLRTKMRTEVLAVLTPEQRAQLKQEMAKARAARRANATKASS